MFSVHLLTSNVGTNLFFNLWLIYRWCPLTSLLHHINMFPYDISSTLLISVYTVVFIQRFCHDYYFFRSPSYKSYQVEILFEIFKRFVNINNEYLYLNTLFSYLVRSLTLQFKSYHQWSTSLPLPQSFPIYTPKFVISTKQVFHFWTAFLSFYK